MRANFTIWKFYLPTTCWKRKACSPRPVLHSVLPDTEAGCFLLSASQKRYCHSCNFVVFSRCIWGGSCRLSKLHSTKALATWLERKAFSVLSLPGRVRSFCGINHSPLVEGVISPTSSCLGRRRQNQTVRQWWERGVWCSRWLPG